MLYFSIKELEF